MLSFSLTHRTDCEPAVVSSEIQLATRQSQFVLNIGKRSVPICLSVPGQHNISNALAAATVCHSIGIKIEQIAEGLERVSGVSSPGQHHDKNPRLELLASVDIGNHRSRAEVDLIDIAGLKLQYGGHLGP